MPGKFTKDTLITLSAKILLLVLGIATSIIVSRVLKPEGRGIYVLALLLPSLLTTFTNLGIGPATVFYIGKKKYSPKEIFGINIIFSLLISTLAIIIGLIIVFFFGDKLFSGVEKEYLLLALSLVPLYLFLNFLIDVFLGLQKIKKYNLILIIQALCSLLLVIIFLLIFHLGIKAAIISEILSFTIACIILFFQIKKEVQGLSIFLNKKIFQDFLLYGAKIYLGNIIGFLQYRIDVFILNIFLNPTAVGFYSIAVALAEKIWLASESAGIVIFPKVSSEKDKVRLKEFTPLVCRNILFFSLLAAASLFLLGHWIIILLYSKSFLASVIPLQILLIGIVSGSASRILANDISGRGKPMINSYIGIITVILNVILNIVLIPKFGIGGAALSSTISYTTTFLIKLIVYSKISGNRIRDIIFIKKSDFRFYKNFLLIFKNKYFNSLNSL